MMNSLRIVNTSSDEEVIKNCIVTNSCIEIYKWASKELLHSSWIIHFLRQIEDWIDISKYFYKDEFYKILVNNINNLDNDSKKTILWKIKSVKRRLKSTQNKELQEIENMIIIEN